MSIPMVTTRFNKDTYCENKRYREKHNIGCIYGPSRRMPCKIPPHSLVLVIEMNNSTNCIEGVGLIKNIVRFDKKYYVYSVGNYNRYTYTSQYRVDREQLLEKCPHIVSLLDILLFRGKTHMKRGCGFTTMPKKLFMHPVCRDFDAEMYIRKSLESTFLSLDHYVVQ